MFFTSEIIPENVIKNSLDNVCLHLIFKLSLGIRQFNKKKRLSKFVYLKLLFQQKNYLSLLLDQIIEKNNKLMLDHIKNNLNSKLLNYYSKITKIVYSQGLFNIIGLLKISLQ